MRQWQYGLITMVLFQGPSNTMLYVQIGKGSLSFHDFRCLLIVSVSQALGDGDLQFRWKIVSQKLNMRTRELLKFEAGHSVHLK